jgi:large conductance mechanosensitive channel
MSQIFSEFKAFISRGNVIDLAVGIIIGAAFTGIVSSLVNDVIMPIIGILTSGVDFSNLFIPLSFEKWEAVKDTVHTLKQAKDAGVPVISVGIFINAVINFLIVSFVIFTLVKQINKLKKAEAEKPAVTPADIVLLTEIRDLLKK